jgi:tRNA nucleotidyltransferase (CCA-adding enzyme)
VVKDVTHLILHHMFNYQEEWTDAAVRRLIARVGEGKIDEIIALRRADQIGMCQENAEVFPEGLARFAERVSDVLSQGRAFSVSQVAVNGRDLMERLGIPPGPQVGVLLQELLQTVLDDPAINEKEKLLEIAEKLYRQRLAK